MLQNMTSHMPFLCVSVAHLPGQAAAEAYHDRVLDHYHNSLSNIRMNPSGETEKIKNATYRDSMKLQVKLNENGKIVKAKFNTF